MRDPTAFEDRVDLLGVPASFWSYEQGPNGAVVDWPGWPLTITRELDGAVTVRATLGGTSEADLETGDLPIHVLGAEVAAALGDDVALEIDPGSEAVRLVLVAGDDLRGACARVAALAPVAAAAVDRFQDLVEPPAMDPAGLMDDGPW